MRKKNLFLSMLAALAFVGCSSENDVVTGGDTDSNKGTSYMAVNLVSSDVMGTRAATGYEDGSDVENNVTSVRFYFFNGAGGAVNVKYQADGSYVNYYDWTPGADDQESGTVDSDDIESKLKATIVINTAGGDKIPQRIAAVLNPPTINGTPLLGSASMNLSTLKEKVADFAASDLTTKGNFVMFNSVGGGGKDLSTTLIEKANLCKSETDAKNNPVTIYVERSVAKVRVTLGTAVSDAGTATGLALKDKDGNEILVEGKPVYLKLDSWGLTAETSEGRLIKKINPGWEGWNWYTNYRSFWAINSMSATNEYKNYGAINTTFAAGNALYTNENAQLTDVDNSEGLAKERTKVIFKGTLCKADGTPLTIVRHLGAYFADSESETDESKNLNQLKKSILNQLVANGKNYYYAIENGRKQIDTTDIKIVIATQQTQEGSKNNCYVYAQLTDAATAKTWYTSLDEKDATTVAYTVINSDLANKEIVDRALVWKSGMTYYYHEIDHLAESGNKGVVRNHIYDVNVTAIAGLGTPVYDPTQVIYPEIPDPNSHYIAAKINILSWRVVTNNVQLGY